MSARYSSLSSEELIKACAGMQNPVAWGEFIRRFHPLISKVVLRTARRWSDPTPQLLDDLIQETYLKLCDDDSRLLRSFESHHTDAIFGFLKTVAANVVRDHFKAAGAEKRGAEKTDPLLDDQRVKVQPRDHQDHLQRGILLRQIDEIVQRVASGESQERNRAIFWLHYRHGLSASAIATIPGFGLSTKGVETALRRMTLLVRSHILAAGVTDNTSATNGEGIRRAKSL